MSGMNEQQQRELTAGLKALADLTRHARASPRIEQAVLAEMSRAVSRRPAFPTRLFPIAAALMIAIGGALWVARTTDRQAPRAVIEPQEFVALPLASALPDIESATIVRVAVPVSALPTYGIAISPDMPAHLVDAELLVAQDGQPRAIRLVNTASITGSTP